MKQETIDKLLELADTAFAEQKAPDIYARAAAHEAAFAAAYQYCPESADATALIAATTFVCETTAAARFSARIADIANHKFANDSYYHAARKSHEDNILPMKAVVETRFLSDIKTAESAAQECDALITSSYVSTFAHEKAASNKAKQAAFYVYSDTYAATRNAYVRAMFIAHQTQDTKKRLKQFKTTMSVRLNKDLLYDNISPGFLLQMMCTSSLQIIAGLLLVAGIAAITLVTCGASAFPVIPTIALGGVSTALGAGLFAGGFFAQRQRRQLDDENQNRMEMGLPA